MRNAYRVVSDLKKSKDVTSVDQCFACNKFFIQKKILERHLQACSSVPGIICKFENQNIQTFLDNMKFMGDLPFSIYFDFETTSAKKIYNFDEDSCLYPVSYSFEVTFYLKISIEKIFVVRSFNHTLEHPNDIGYLSNEMLDYFDPITARQLRDCALVVHQKKDKFSLSEMFFCELKFVFDLLKNWLGEKYFRRFKELDFSSKQKFKRKNHIDWNETRCVICGFRLPVAASNFPNKKITTYLDFVIAKEHASIRNIFDRDELKRSMAIATLEKCHESFRKILQIVVLLSSSYMSESDIEDISDDCIAAFVNEKNFDSFSDLFLEINNTHVKNIDCNKNMLRT